MWSFTTVQKKVQWLTARRIRCCCVGKFQFSLLIRKRTASVSSFGVFHVLLIVEAECDMNSNRIKDVCSVLFDF